MVAPRPAGAALRSTLKSPVDQMHVGYVKQVLNFIGITDIEVVRAPGLVIGAEVRAHSIANAKGQIRELFMAQPA